jgi:tetratricopeptide (TPR) repeat protein
MRWLFCGLLCLAGVGCHVVNFVTRPAKGTPVADVAESPRGSPVPVVATPVSEPKSNHLTLAAMHLEKGEDALACSHLGKFLATNPEHRNARFYHADLLMKLGKVKDARDQFERVIAYGQEDPEPDLNHLANCHGRVLEAAEVLADQYLIHLHRGIGMYLLALESAKLRDEDNPFSFEALLCKAAGELATASKMRPAEARPCWYLHAVWQQLAQPSQASRWLHEAQRTSPWSHLTPCEQRQLQLALSREQDSKMR